MTVERPLGNMGNSTYELNAESFRSRIAFVSPVWTAGFGYVAGASILW